MDNRNSYSPILFALAFSFIVAFSLSSQAEPGVPDSLTATNSTPAATSHAQAPAALPTKTAPAPAVTPAAGSTTYTVAAGDVLGTIAKKFGTTVKQLQKANNLKKGALLHPGQVLQIPPAKSAAPTAPAPAVPVATPKPPKTTSQSPVTPKPVTTAPLPKKSGSLAQSAPLPKPTTTAQISKKTSHSSPYAKAQPVQDFDIPASTFASCPPPANSTDADADFSAPVAKLVSPSEMAADSTPDTDTFVEPTVAPKPLPKALPVHPAATASSPSAFVPPPAKLTSRTPNTNPFYSTPSSDWGNRFLQQARTLGDRGIEYDEDWRPPGESSSWTMDCSNTARYLYKVTAGIELPRTASDQYYYLHLQNKAWDLPEDVSDVTECKYLRENLKPGDLLFWENTYRPERQPPITHVMVFLGTNDRGQWIMAGSQTSRGGEHNRRNGGPDVYVFNPTQPCGGYTTWLGMVHHHGRFCAYGRPLEADKTKLAVAAND